jgi:hypothetical protein
MKFEPGLSITGKHAKGVAEWFEYWHIPFNLSPKGMKLTTHHDNSEDLHYAMRLEAKGEIPKTNGNQARSK